MVFHARPLQWYAEWMIGDDSRNQRKLVAEELLKSISEGTSADELRHSLGSLNELLLFEHLCISNKSTRQDINASASPTVDHQNLVVLPVTWLEQVVSALSQCLVKAFTVQDHLERKLQGRALLVALTLLQDNNVDGFQHDFHDEVRRALEARFRDLRWRKGSTGAGQALTSESLRRVQCSYLQSASFEMLASFTHAQPQVVRTANRVISFLSFGLTVTSPALVRYFLPYHDVQSSTD